MAVTSGNRLKVQLAEAFGIPTKRLLGFEIVVRPNQIVHARAEYALDIDPEQLVNVVRKLNLEAKEAEESKES